MKGNFGIMVEIKLEENQILSILWARKNCNNLQKERNNDSQF